MEAPPPTPTPTPTPTAPTSQGGAKKAKSTHYENRTLKELQKLAKKHNIVFSGLNKSQLINVLRVKL